ncbi:hypothetical protein BEN71_07740 [Acinetobacter wuhouensis]|uniref:Uncharacterized protein n=1 Tax=Acinetobacter wuhouensis TaxID=1879050 RepID=A0A385C2K1_9GAMM|nr:hypothetical protein [Acinetobacter wuhouensis]AXQ21960.1 hypothetical protein BEN71_07740 [Acinetobacter wuhouensis]AYO54829.1 hypothetical protein CDG68_14730 [Acinetobacter wuhouensis]
MREEIKIAIFGLSLNVLDTIKQKVRLMYDDSLDVSWANIADPHLDILLVNDMFFSSPTIQNLVGAKKVPYLRLVNKNEKSGQIEGDKLYLPFIATDEIRNWFKDRYLDVPVSIKAVNIVNQISKNVDITKVIPELFNERNGNVQIFDGKGNIALASIRTQQVWPDVSRKIQGTDASLNYTYATMQMAQAVSVQQGVDLTSWLWDLLWYSDVVNEKHNSSNCYKLLDWPQPIHQNERQMIFKIAACFERGASIQQVAQKTDYSEAEINRFVSVGLLSQVLKKISADETKLVEKVEQSSGVLRGFFGKLRKKLGL